MRLGYCLIWIDGWLNYMIDKYNWLFYVDIDLFVFFGDDLMWFFVIIFVFEIVDLSY